MLKYIYNTGGTRCLNLHHKQRLSLASVTTYLGLNHMDVVDRHPCMLRYTEGRIILLGEHVDKSKWLGTWATWSPQGNVFSQEGLSDFGRQWCAAVCYMYEYNWWTNNDWERKWSAVDKKFGKVLVLEQSSWCRVVWFYRLLLSVKKDSICCTTRWPHLHTVD